MSKADPAANFITKSLIIPVYKNEANIPTLLDAIEDLAKKLGKEFEVVFVVDGSPDKSFELLADRLPSTTFSSQLVSLSKNFGSFSAIRSGLESARGRFFAIMAADLQEPPELVGQFFKELAVDRADVIFGKRECRSDGLLSDFFSKLFWKTYKRFVLPDIPEGGVDIFACNEAVRSVLLKFEETNSSLVAQLFWVGFRRLYIPYERRERIHGESAWNFSRKFRYMLDSIFSFSDLPIMALLWLGLVGCTVSIFLSIVIFLFWLFGAITEPGYTPIMLGLLFLGSIIMTSQGIIGCYVWRTSENTKGRPLTIIASKTVFNGSAKRLS